MGAIIPKFMPHTSVTTLWKSCIMSSDINVCRDEYVLEYSPTKKSRKLWQPGLIYWQSSENFSLGLYAL